MSRWPDPGGALGHASGIAGMLLMLWAAFGYSWRKNPAHRARGSARVWMRSHVAAGLAGPTLVLLHGGLAFRGLAGMTTILMLVVVASGAVGRWLYTALPRGADLPDGAPARLHSGARARSVLAAWWVLHVPVSMAMLLLALIHTLAAMYYRTPAR